MTRIDTINAVGDRHAIGGRFALYPGGSIDIDRHRPHAYRSRTACRCGCRVRYTDIEGSLCIACHSPWEKTP